MKKKALNIVADAHVWGVRSAFSSLPGFNVDLSVLEHGEITRETVKRADILLTRSSTKVGEALLEGAPVRFVATATVGDDHYDKKWLECNRIRWASAAGSSTGSVVEYMTAALLELHIRSLISLPDTTLGIIGAGRIGSAVAEVCGVMGMQLLKNDPPRERAEHVDGFVPIEHLLEEADIITLHTPLNRGGEDRTYHLIDTAFLDRFQGRGVINTARGGCIDNVALAAWLDGDAERFAVLDCWESEPNISRSLLAHPQLVIATPHIAGHSLDGKAANTQYIYDALCSFLDIHPTWSAKDELPAAEELVTVAVDHELWRSLHTLATTLYPITRDDQQMKGWLNLSGDSLAAFFSSYRRNYPVRRAWGSGQVRVVNAGKRLIQCAEGIGIGIVTN